MWAVREQRRLRRGNGVGRAWSQTSFSSYIINRCGDAVLAARQKMVEHAFRRRWPIGNSEIRSKLWSECKQGNELARKKREIREREFAIDLVVEIALRFPRPSQRGRIEWGPRPPSGAAN